MSRVRIENVEVVLDSSMRSISFTAVGDPPVQQRPKITYKARKHPVYYDPSAGDKTRWQLELKRALVDCGVSEFPFFSADDTNIMASTGLEINVIFHVSRRRADYEMSQGTLVLREDHQKYPGKKDIDNMLKFLMDSFDKVLYHNDRCVVVTNARKKFVDEANKEKGAYTTIKISKME
jgi:Holliday junction resolvase RusA-like endonuclease